jgi:hypothetical protein
MTAQADGQRTRRLSLLRRIVAESPELGEAFTDVLDACRSDEDLERAWLGGFYFAKLRRQSQDVMDLAGDVWKRGIPLTLVINVDPTLKDAAERVDLEVHVAGRRPYGT